MNHLVEFVSEEGTDRNMIEATERLEIPNYKKK